MTRRPCNRVALHPEHVPSDLSDLDQWIWWDEHKIPHNPRTGREAKTNDPSTWGSFQAARAAAHDPRRRGIGFVLTTAAGIVGIDLDGCRDPTSGAIAGWAREIIEAVDSYTELSPSGEGVHILARGSLPPGRRETTTDGHKIEMYDDRRYFTVTGCTVDGRTKLAGRPEAIARLHRRVFGPPNATRVCPPAPSDHPTPDDDRILAIADRAINGEKFRRLWAGDTADHGGDDSRADAALVQFFCFYSPDDAQVDRLFRGSGLMRAKWDERRGSQTYGERTIADARARLTHAYTPGHQVARPAPAHPSTALGTGPAPHTGTTGTDHGDLAALRRQVAELQRQLTERDRTITEQAARITELEQARANLSLLQSRTMLAMRSKQLGSEKLTGIALAFEVANKQSAGEVPADGFIRIPLKRLGEQAGCSDQTAGDHLGKLEPLGLFERRVRWIPETIDTETGEIIKGHRETFIRPTASPPEMLDTLATATPAKPKHGHGGRRLTCPACGDAGTVTRWTTHCATCDRHLDHGETHRPATTTSPDLAATVGGVGVNSQDDRTTNDSHAGGGKGTKGQTIKMIETRPSRPTAPRQSPPSVAIGASCGGPGSSVPSSRWGP